MAVIPFVPETKMAHVGKLNSIGNLLVRKVTWIMLITTSATLILSRAFGADCIVNKDCLYILSSSKNSLSPLRLPETAHSLIHSIETSRDSTLSHSLHWDFTETAHSHIHSIVTHRDNTLSHIFTYRDSTHIHTHTLSLSLSLSLSHTHILTSSSQPHENVCILQPFSFRFCFSVRLFPASNKVSEISSNAERDKQSTWEKTRSS